MKDAAHQVYLVRHGQTEWSLSGRHTGRSELPLTAEGERDAVRLRERLRSLAVAHVLCSPRERARRTCVLAGFGDRMQVDDDLREWDYGGYEGKTSAEIEAGRPGWNLFLDGCPGGESPEQISARADRIAARLRAFEGAAAVFSHGHFLRVLAVRWLGWPVAEGEHLVLGTGTLSLLEEDARHGGVPALGFWNA